MRRQYGDRGGDRFRVAGILNDVPGTALKFHRGGLNSTLAENSARAAQDFAVWLGASGSGRTTPGTNGPRA